MARITPKQEAFARAYIETAGNASEAYPITTVTTTGDQALNNTVTLPRYADGAGVQAFLTPSTVMGAGTPNIRLTYTDSGGTAGNLTPATLPIGNTAAPVTQIVYSGTGAGKFGPFIPLATGDAGIRSVQQFNLSASYVSGVLNLVLCKPLMTMPITTLAASSTAMTAVWASDTAADAVMTSSAARLAVYNADTALAALQANPAQVQRQIGIGGRTTTSSNPWSSSINIVANSTKLILLRRWYSGAEHDYINWARGSATNGAGNGPVAGSGGRTLYTGAGALGCVSGTYASTGAAPTVNDVTGNFVCAANGLRRDSASSGATQNVIYITV